MPGGGSGSGCSIGGNTYGGMYCFAWYPSENRCETVRFKQDTTATMVYNENGELCSDYKWTKTTRQWYRPGIPTPICDPVTCTVDMGIAYGDWIELVPANESINNISNLDAQFEVAVYEVGSKSSTHTEADCTPQNQ